MAITFVAAGATLTQLNDGVSRNVANAAGVTLNDLLLNFWSIKDSATPNTPSGFSLIGGSSVPQGSNNALQAFGKLAGASEPGVYATSMVNAGGGRDAAVSVAAFRGTDTASVVHAQALRAQQTGTTTPAAAPITTTVDNCTLVIFTIEYNQHNAVFTPPSGYTSIKSGPSGTAFNAAYKHAVGAAGTYSPGNWSSTVSGDYWSLTIALAPAAVPLDISGPATPDEVQATGTIGPGAPTVVSGAATPDEVQALGSISSTLTISGAATPDEVRASGTISPAPGVLTTLPFGNWVAGAAAPLTGLVLDNVWVIHMSTKARVLTLTSQVTNGAGRLVLADPALVTGAIYGVFAFSNDGLTYGFRAYTAT